MTSLDTFSHNTRISLTVLILSGCQDRAAQARPEVRAEQPADQRGAEGGQEAEGGQRPQAQQARRRPARLREGQARRQGARVICCCQLYYLLQLVNIMEKIAMLWFAMQ